MSDLSNDYDIVRAAARLMRTRAHAATPGPWDWAPWDLHPTQRRVTLAVFNDAEELIADVRPEGPRATETADAEHIAAFSPVIAEAVAALLDDVLADADRRLRSINKAIPAAEIDHVHISPAAVNLAKLYLGDHFPSRLDEDPEEK